MTHATHAVRPESLDAEQHVLRSGSAARWRVRVLRYIASRGPFGATADETLVALGAPSPNTIAPRITALLAEREVERSGRTRKTRSGRRAAVYVAAPTQGALL